MRLVQSYFVYNHARSIRIICGSVFVTIYAAMGMLLSLMEGFRRAYRVPHGQWGFWKERVVALALVPGAMIPMAAATLFLAFGHSIEHWMIENTNLELHLYLVLLWRLIRWMIALFASIVSLALVYHYAVPRQKLRARAGRFHLGRSRWRETLPGATIATATWFIATLIYGWYLTRFSDYSIVYGSLGAGVATLVWLYMVSLIILIGAEFNAQMFPLPRADEISQAAAGQENVAPRSATV
jgi:membrane protein